MPEIEYKTDLQGNVVRVFPHLEELWIEIGYHQFRWDEFYELILALRDKTHPPKPPTPLIPRLTSEQIREIRKEWPDPLRLIADKRYISTTTPRPPILFGGAEFNTQPIGEGWTSSSTTRRPSWPSS